MAPIRLPRITAALVASIGLAALLTCGLGSGIASIGFGIDRGGHWDTYIRGGLSGGKPLDTVSSVAKALPAKAGCGTRWLLAQPQLARMAELERDKRLSEASAVCQRAAQEMLGCVPTSSIYSQCFRLNKEIAIQQCRATCDPVMCRAAKMSCGQ